MFYIVLENGISGWYVYMGLGSSKKFYNVLHGFGHKNGVSSEIVDLEKLKEG